MAAFVVCDSFIAECLQGGIHLDSHTYKMAIFQRTAGTSVLGELGRGTTAYAATVNGRSEVTAGTTGYTAGGIVLTPDADVTTNIFHSGTGATVRKATGWAGYDWANAVFSTVTLNSGADDIKTNGFYALIYNSTDAGKRAVAVGEWVTNDLTAAPASANLTITLPSTGNVAVKITT